MVMRRLSETFLLLLFVFVLAGQGFAEWIDRTDEGGVVTASSQIGDYESKEMAFDNTSTSKWLTNFTPTGWLQFQFPNNNRYTISRYTITSANDAQPRDPHNWTLYGSNDEGNTWSIVDEKSGQFWTDRFQLQSFDCDTPNSYNIYRLDITLNNGAVDLTGFSEMELLEETYIANNPTPSNGQWNISTENISLSWDSPVGVSNPTYTLYVGQSLDLVQNGDPSVFKAEQTVNSFQIESLDTFSTYYWRVDIFDGAELYKGNIWSFQTEQPNIACLPQAADINYDCIVDMTDLVLLASQWLGEGTQLADTIVDLDGSAKVNLSDFASVSSHWYETTPDIMISEIMADNETVLADNFGEYPDWIEIKNLSDIAQSLQGWYLTDDDDDLTKWAFPDVMIDAKGYKVIYASGLDNVEDPEYLHTNFKLSNGGEYLALVTPDGRIAHEFSPEYPELGNDESYGLTIIPGDTEYITSYLSEPTPWEGNAFAVVSSRPEFSVRAGLYDDPFTLEITVPDPECLIRYTLDGTDPTGTSALYTGAMTISHTACFKSAAFKGDYLPGKVVTRSFIFLDDVLAQPTMPDGFPTMWKTYSPDYAMASDIVNDATYGPLIKPALKSYPTLSIVTDLDNLFNSATGIYVNPLQTGVEWERPISMEIFWPGKNEEFQINCGLRIQGGAFRGFNLTHKKSFRLMFKTDYGPGKLDYPLFDDYYDSAVSEFDTIILRAGANDGYSWDAAGATVQYSRDEFGRLIQRDTGNHGAHGMFAHVYINGLYWGLYNAVERPDHSFCEHYYGGDKDDWDAINSGAPNNGDMTVWNNLLSKCQDGITTLDEYEEIQGNNPDGSRNPNYPILLDMENYIDYLIVNFWGGNGDWPWRNYRLARLKTEESTGFKFFIWDYEGTTASPFAQFDKVSQTNNNQGAGIPHWNLRNNEEYRILFGDRVHRLFFNGGAFSPVNVIQRYSEVSDWVEAAIIPESARWGDMHRTPSYNIDDWYVKRDDVLINYLPGRTEDVLAQMIANNLYPSVGAPIFNIGGDYQHGGYFNASEAFSISLPATNLLEQTLVEDYAAVEVHYPTNDTLGTSWTELNYNTNATWTDGTLGVGYENGSGYQDWLGTNTYSEMYNQKTSVYTRIEFNYDGNKTIEELILKMRYDDAFVAYINGTEVSRSANIYVSIPGQTDLSNGHEAQASYESFDISAYKSLIQVGDNVLAIHGINVGETSSDFIIQPQLVMAYEAESTTSPVWYTTDGSDPRMPGGAINPAAIEYTGQIPLHVPVQFKARTLTEGQWSALNEAWYAPAATTDDLRITEIMYHSADPNCDYIEFKNIGDITIQLSGVRVTKGVDFDFGPIPLAAGHYLLLVKDLDAFEAKYGTGLPVGGVYEGDLDNAGEQITLKDGLGEAILKFDFKDSWYDITDGEGFSLTIKDETASDTSLWDDKAGWRPSATIGGSPGSDDNSAIPTIGSVVINEILAHSDTIAYDWIELYNTTDEDINIGGWYLSDNNDDPNRMKYRIADGTILHHDSYVVFNEIDHFANSSDPGCLIPFRLSENGETLYLQSGIDGTLTGYVEEEKFGASEKDTAFGRHQNSTGTFNFVPMSTNTPGSDNAYPKVGPMIINEIMYNPPSGGLLDNDEYEYITLLNITPGTVTLQEWDDAANAFIPWAFTEGIDYTFPATVTVPSYGKIYVVKNPDAFMERYPSVDPGLVYGPFDDSQLSNGGEKIELGKPGDIADGKRMYIRVDRVTYSDGSHGDDFGSGVDPWPTSADGDGNALHQKTPLVTGQNYSNDVANWQAGPSSLAD